MDPCAVLPPEVMESVWSNLRLNDLLSSRLVSTDWKVVLGDSTVWKRYTAIPTGVLPWTHFLEERKIDFAWTWGNFKMNVLIPGTELGEGKICLGKNHIYLMKDATIVMYDKALKNVCNVHYFPEDWYPVKMKCEGDILAVMTANGRQRAMEILKGWKLVCRSPAVGTSFSIGPDGEVVYECEGGLSVWHEGVTGVMARPPGEEIEELVITRILVGAMVRHSVREGMGFTVYRKQRQSSYTPWETAHCARNMSPIITVYGQLLAAEHRMLFTVICISHHWSSIKQILLGPNEERCNRTALGYLSGPYMGLAIFESPGHDVLVIENLDTGMSCSFTMGEGRPRAFFCRSHTKVVLPFDDGTIRGFRNSTMTYVGSLGMKILGADFEHDSALLWNKDTAISLTIKLADDFDNSSDLPTIRYS